MTTPTTITHLPDPTSYRLLAPPSPSASSPSISSASSPSLPSDHECDAISTPPPLPHPLQTIYYQHSTLVIKTYSPPVSASLLATDLGTVAAAAAAAVAAVVGGLLYAHNARQKHPAHKHACSCICIHTTGRLAQHSYSRPTCPTCIYIHTSKHPATNTNATHSSMPD